jgi:uncharacterized membrane protein
MAKKSSKSRKEKQVISSVSNEKLCSILSYVIIGLIWYLADEKIRTQNTKFHVKQGLVLLIAELINGAIWGIPFIGEVIAPIINLGLIILIIIGVINVANEKNSELPIIGQFGKKFNF